MGWTARFKSFNEIDCSIEINGGGTEVTASATPIIFDEGDSDDLLDVVRFKTGYINLMETYDGELDDIYPETNTSRKVMVRYGTDVVFVGFIQAQSFENKWEGSIREMQFPIISPLGLLESMTLPTYNPPRAVTLASLLADVVDALNNLGAEYNYIVWPQMSVLLSETVSSLVFCPFNSDHDPTSVSPPLFAPRTCLEFIEGLCNAFGWMVHDNSLEIVFTKFDHTGSYLRCAKENIRTLTQVSTDSFSGQSEFLLESFFKYADDDGKISTVMPVEEVEIEYDGEYVKNSNLNFDHLTYHSYTRDGNQLVAWLSSGTPELTGQKLNFNNMFTNGKLSYEGCNACSFGNPSHQEEGILVNLPNSTIHDTELFTVKFYERPTGNGFQIKYNTRWSDIILNLGNEDISHKKLGIRVKIGNQYYQGGGEWSTNRGGVYSYGSEEHYWVDGITNAPEGFPVEVSFYETQPIGTNPVQLIAVTNIRLEELPEVFSDYRVVKRETDTIRIANGNGQGKATVSMPITCYRKNNSQIGTSIVSNRFTEYTYLLKSREQLTIKMKRQSSLASVSSRIYQSYVKYNDKKWRTISISQNIREDECTIVLQRMIENN